MPMTLERIAELQRAWHNATSGRAALEAYDAVSAAYHQYWTENGIR